MTDTTNETKPKKATPVVTNVVMKDGRTVAFTGKQRMKRDSTVAEDGSVTSTFDFLNGETRSIKVAADHALAAKFLGLGIETKVGQSTNKDEKIEDMISTVDKVVERLTAGEWGAERTGDGTSGENVVVRAIVELSGKTVEFVKETLDKKLADGKASGLTRRALYASFRKPGTKTAAVIERLEANKGTAVDADELLQEFEAE